MHSISKWQKINFKTSQFNHFAFFRKSMTYDGHDIAKAFFATHSTNPIWVRVQRISSFFLSYCKQKFYHHLCKGWGFMLQYQGNMPWWRIEYWGWNFRSQYDSQNYLYKFLLVSKVSFFRLLWWELTSFISHQLVLKADWEKNLLYLNRNFISLHSI